MQQLHKQSSMLKFRETKTSNPNDYQKQLGKKLGCSDSQVEVMERI